MMPQHIPTYSILWREAYFFANSELSDEEKERRKALFGSFSDAC